LTLTQRSRCAATLGFGSKPLRGYAFKSESKNRAPDPGLDPLKREEEKFL
jgi:hypothetical protein